VICSNTSSLPEVTGNAGLLIDPLETDSLSSAMRRVLGNEDLRNELVQRGRAQAARFSWQSAARQTLKVLESAAESKVSRA
jgi:glycosyltransferase involved in cell wall biosynthesis